MKVWSAAQLRGFIRQSLRKLWFRHPVHLAARERAVVRREPWMKKDGTPRTRKGKPLFLKFYQCNRCKGEFKGSQIQIDHIKPIGPAPGARYSDDKSSWDEVVTRMLYVDVNDLQALCVDCHKIKTAEDKASFKDGTWRG